MQTLMRCVCFCSPARWKRKRGYSDLHREEEMRRRHYEEERARMRMKEDLWRRATGRRWFCYCTFCQFLLKDSFCIYRLASIIILIARPFQLAFRVNPSSYKWSQPIWSNISSRPGTKLACNFFKILRTEDFIRSAVQSTKVHCQYLGLLLQTA